MTASNKIFLIMGKSGSGKDTIFQRLKEDKSLGLTAIVPYTTRPRRGEEKEGNEYYFTDEDGYQKYCEQGKIIEARAYETYHGRWRYFTLDDGQFDFEQDSQPRLMIGTLESYLMVKEYFANVAVIPIMIELADGIRLTRALEREKKQQNPKFEEMCRRFLADAEDFADELIIKAGIERRFDNEASERCLAEITEYIGKA
jgi:guanylate kinase